MTQLLGNNQRSSGVWTPTISFVTPGDLVVAYSSQLGEWYRSGNWIELFFVIITSTFTFTTSSGAFFINGHGFVPKTKAGFSWCGSLFAFQGITKASFTQFTPGVGSGDGRITIQASGSAQSTAALAPADMPTGTLKNLQGRLGFPLS